jgi:hypothetical protein
MIEVTCFTKHGPRKILIPESERSEQKMRGSRRSEEQIIAALKQAEKDTAELFRREGIS